MNIAQGPSLYDELAYSLRGHLRGFIISTDITPFVHPNVRFRRVELPDRAQRASLANKPERAELLDKPSRVKF